MSVSSCWEGWLIQGWSTCTDFEIIMEAVSTVLPEVGCGAEVSWEVMKMSLVLKSAPEREGKEKEKEKERKEKGKEREKRERKRKRKRKGKEKGKERRWGLRQGDRSCLPWSAVLAGCPVLKWVQVWVANPFLWPWGLHVSESASEQMDFVRLGRASF